MLLMLYYSSWQLLYTCTFVTCDMTPRLTLLSFIGLHMELDCIEISSFNGSNPNPHLANDRAL